MFVSLHHDFMLSSLMVSRQMSYSAFCVCAPACPLHLPVLPLFEEAMKEVAVKTTPLPPRQPHRSIFKKKRKEKRMRSDDTRAPGALLSHVPRSPFLFRPRALVTSSVACFEGRKSALTLRQEIAPTTPTRVQKTVMLLLYVR